MDDRVHFFLHTVCDTFIGPVDGILQHTEQAEVLDAFAQLLPADRADNVVDDRQAVGQGCFVFLHARAPVLDGDEIFDQPRRQNGRGLRLRIAWRIDVAP